MDKASENNIISQMKIVGQWLANLMRYEDVSKSFRLDAAQDSITRCIQQLETAQNLNALNKSQESLAHVFNICVGARKYCMGVQEGMEEAMETLCAPAKDPAHQWIFDVEYNAGSPLHTRFQHMERRVVTFKNAAEKIARCEASVEGAIDAIHKETVRMAHAERQKIKVEQ